MPAKSKAQQKAAGAALAAKRGEQPKKKLKGASRGMYGSMSESELEDLASTKRKNLPRKVAKKPAEKKPAAKSAPATKLAKTSDARSTSAAKSTKSAKRPASKTARKG